MNIAAYIISALVIAITIILLTVTLIPLFNQSIKLQKTNKKTIIWFSIIMVMLVLEILTIVVSLLGEASHYITPAPGTIWLVFKIFSLLFLWAWSFIYFFIWIKFKKSK